MKGDEDAECCISDHLQAVFFKKLSTQQLLSTSSPTPKGSAKIIKTPAGGLVLQEVV